MASLFVLECSQPGGTFTSSGNLSGNFSNPASLTGMVSLNATDGLVRDISFKHLALVATSAGGSLRLDTLAADLGRNSLKASGDP